MTSAITQLATLREIAGFQVTSVSAVGRLLIGPLSLPSPMSVVPSPPCTLRLASIIMVVVATERVGCVRMCEIMSLITPETAVGIHNMRTCQERLSLRMPTSSASGESQMVTWFI